MWGRALHQGHFAHELFALFLRNGATSSHTTVFSNRVERRERRHYCEAMLMRARVTIWVTFIQVALQSESHFLVALWLSSRIKNRCVRRACFGSFVKGTRIHLPFSLS